MACWAESPHLSLESQAKSSDAWGIVVVDSAAPFSDGGRTVYVGSVVNTALANTGATIALSVPSGAIDGDSYLHRSDTAQFLPGGAYLVFVKSTGDTFEPLYGAASVFALKPSQGQVPELQAFHVAADGTATGKSIGSLTSIVQSTTAKAPTSFLSGGAK